MAITESVGYDGSDIFETQWAQMSRLVGSRFAFGGPNDLRVSVVSGVDRTVRIRYGFAFGDGVLDKNATDYNMQLPAVSSGSRWDAIVLRRDWQPAGGLSAFQRVPGTAVQAVPLLLDDPGTVADQPLALVEVVAGQQLPRTVINLRKTAHKLVVADSLLAIADEPQGVEAVVAGIRYRRELVSGTVESVPQPRSAGGLLTNLSFVNGYVSTPHGLPWTPRVFLPGPRVAAGSALMIAVAAGPNPITDTNVALRAIDAATGTPFAGSVSTVDFWASE